MIIFPQIYLRLDYIYTYNPPIIYRDIKPLNILYRLRKYLLSNFSITKTINNSYTLVRTNSYRARELQQGGDQTTSLDIYRLSTTIIKALGGFPDPAKRPATWQLQHRYLQTFVSKRPIILILANSPSDCLTAHQIICTLFPNKLP